ncbi:MAG: hypothetical protein MJY67_06710 [Bacteroidales bacterium]|nr:hypothetical protein [Bacteroidales bacterium]
MKKAIILAALIAMAMIPSFTSCIKMSDKLAYSATFHVPDTLYNGQECKIQRYRLFDYTFVADQPDVADLKLMSGKDWYLTVTLPSDKPVTVKLTSDNAKNYGENHQVTKSVTVFPWVLDYDFDDDSVRVDMMGVNEKGEKFNVASARGIWTSWNSHGSLEWNYSSDAFELVEKGKTYLILKFKKDVLGGGVKATLGEVQSSVMVKK